MAVLDIVLYPDEPLVSKAEPIAEVDDTVTQLAKDMVETMFTYDGVGLAGPQVGVSKRIFVMCEPGGTPQCLINPEILEKDGREEGEEGCLSLPQIYAERVPRATRVRVRGLDELGKPVEFEVHGFVARIIQHENDHLDGIVFPDRLDIITREATLQDWRELRQRMMQEAGQRA